MIAGIDDAIHKKCLDARDYAGCVQAASKATVQSGDQLTELRKAMKKVAARLRSGVSYANSSSVYQPVVDQLALVRQEHPKALAVEKAILANTLFDALRESRYGEINSIDYQASRNNYRGGTVYNCSRLNRFVSSFNNVYGSEVVGWRYTPKPQGLLGLKPKNCVISDYQLPTRSMMKVVIKTLEQGSISPEEIAKKEEAKRLREEQRAAKILADEENAWNKHVAEQGDNYRQWLEANPSLAKEAKEKWLAPYREKQKESDRFTSSFILGNGTYE